MITVPEILAMNMDTRASLAHDSIKTLITQGANKIIQKNLKSSPNVRLKEVSVNAIANLAYISKHCKKEYLRKIARRRLTYIEIKFKELK